MPDPTAKIIAISQLRAVADLAEVCDRDGVLEILRNVNKLQQRLDRMAHDPKKTLTGTQHIVLKS
jgi:hypothetical protein